MQRVYPPGPSALQRVTTHQPSLGPAPAPSVPERDRPRGKWGQDCIAGVPASHNGISHFVQRPFRGRLVPSTSGRGWDGMG